MVLVSLSLVLTVLVLNAFYRGTNGRRVPQWAKLYIMRYLGRLVCASQNKVKDFDFQSTKGEPRHEINMKVTDIDIRSEQYNHNQPDNNNIKLLDDKKTEDEINSEWRDLANIMDRLFLVIFLLITVIVTLALMLQCVVQ